MNADASTKARLIEFLKWYFSKYWQVRTRWVFAQTVTYSHVCTYKTQKSIELLATHCMLVNVYYQACMQLSI